MLYPLFLRSDMRDARRIIPRSRSASICVMLPKSRIYVRTRWHCVLFIRCSFHRAPLPILDKVLSNLRAPSLQGLRRYSSCETQLALIRSLRHRASLVPPNHRAASALGAWLLYGYTASRQHLRLRLCCRNIVRCGVHHIHTRGV